MKRFRWVLIPIAGLIGLAVVVTVIGALLPADHTASRTVTIARPVDTVWAVVRDFARYPDWWSTVSRAERLADTTGREVWTLAMSTGPLPLEVSEVEPPRRMVTTIADESLPFGGTWTYEIAAAGGDSRLTVTENGTVRNPFFRFMARFVFGYAGTIESFLGDLTGHLDGAAQ